MAAESQGSLKVAKMSAESRRILIIDDERTILMTLEALLSRHGFQPETAANASYGLRALKEKSPAVVLLDLQLPDADGLELLAQIKREHPETQVIILTAHDSLNNAIESIKLGAYHFISKPYAPEELLSLIEKALEKRSLLRETEELREKTHQLEKRLEIAETRLAPRAGAARRGTRGRMRPREARSQARQKFRNAGDLRGGARRRLFRHLEPVSTPHVRARAETGGGACDFIRTDLVRLGL